MEEEAFAQTPQEAQKDESSLQINTLPTSASAGPRTSRALKLIS